MIRWLITIYLVVAIFMGIETSSVEEIHGTTEQMEKIKEENRQLKEENQILKEQLNTKEKLSSKDGDTESFNHDFTKGQIWEIPGKWRVQVHHAKSVEDRNNFSEQSPAQVILVEYSYENLGYDHDGEGLYIYTDRILDEQGKMGYVYPLPLNDYPRKTPVGGTCDGEQSFGIDHPSKTVHVYFEIYDEAFERHTAVFKMPVEY
ncbi:MAG: cell division protein ZapB [Tissierellia bacterium]|nr:cell division protein ZapB [Tissierellia bacterium]